MIMLKTTRTNLGRVIDDFFNDPFLETDSYLPTVTPDNIAISTGRSNLLEDDNSYRLEMQVPGLTKKDISITAERGHLNISSKSEDKFKVDNKTYIRRDFYNTELELDYRLPENVDMDNIKAKVENGI